MYYVVQFEFIPYYFLQTLHFVELFDHDFAAGVKSGCASYKFR